MNRTLFLVPLLLLATVVVLADETPRPEREAAASTEAQPQKKKEDAKAVSGMSILGNQEAPKSLVIVPWKGSELGDPLGLSTLLDNSRQPVDRDVFMRALNYYEIRSGRK